MMEENPLHNWLASLTGDLQPGNPNDPAVSTDELFKHLKLSLPVSAQLGQSRLPKFAFENIQPSPIASLHTDLREQVLKVAGAEGMQGNEFKVFVRESPVRDVNALRSIPSWASGAAVDRTFGPFVNIDGRRLWFDFFRVEKLVAIYNNVSGFPPLLFNITVSKLWSNTNKALLAPTEQHYDLDKDSSIWILSTLLAANAPAGKYTGLTISSGTIDISEMPVINEDKTTVSANAVITVKLKLRQQKVTDPDITSQYGQDARDADYTLPDTLEFHFSGSAGSKVDFIAESKSFMFGQSISYKWEGAAGNYNADIAQLGFPLKASEEDFIINKSASDFTQFAGKGKILIPFWGLPFADLDLANIHPAAGIGGIGIIADKGLSATWTNLQHGPIQLNLVIIGGQPGVLGIATGLASNIYARQRFLLWQDKQNPNASSAEVTFGKQFKFQFFSVANGNEVLDAVVNASIDADRPIDVSARPIPIKTKDSFFVLMANKAFKALLLFDNNIIADNFVADTNNPFPQKTMSLALENALFTTSDVNGLFLAGELSHDWKKVNKGMLYTAFAVYKYIPMLPDPYAANIGIFQRFVETRVVDTTHATTSISINVKLPIMVLLCQVKFGLVQPGEPDNADVAFHLLPFVLPASIKQKEVAFGGSFNESQENQNVDFTGANIGEFTRGAVANDLGWSRFLDTFFKDDFSLLDVSSHANQMGISFGSFGGSKGRVSLIKEFGVNTESDQLQSLYSIPFKIVNKQMTSPSLFTRSFLLPLIAWEPVHNLTPAHVAGDPPDGLNFYPDDGGATRIFNNSLHYVPLAPKPVIKDIIRRYKEENGNVTWSYFTLPFGLKALSILSREKQAPHAPKIHGNRPVFNNDLRGGIQVQFDAGKLHTDKFPMFNGAIEQLSNILDANGNITNAGTLGRSVSTIFNKEFTFHPGFPLIENRGVPLSRIDYSGYGASIFNNWFNPYAQIAQTSQTKFDVFVGRTAHEVIQVRSIVYPWGIHVVRTVVLYRTNTGYVYRVDTGWQAESDGEFNFNYNLLIPPETENSTPQDSHYNIHPGIIKGLFSIKNIVEVNELPFNTKSIVRNGDHYLNANNEVKLSDGTVSQAAVLQKITFDANIEIEGVIQGGDAQSRVASRGIVGYVQLAPMGVPLSPAAFTQLITHAGGSIGAAVNCVVDINGSNQRMRLNRVDVSNEITGNSNDVFIAAARGSAILPKDGSWSMVRHTASSGEVVPLPENITVPLIRVGKLVMSGNGDVALFGNPKDNLLRIANPTELLRAPALNTINYGFLQNTGTQKALFLTPAFQEGVQQLMSKTPPLFSDAYRMMSSKAIFPNIGDAINNFKDAIPLDFSKFSEGALKDGADKVFQLMKVASNVADDAGQLQDQAYKLLKNVEDFDLPTGDWKLIDEDFLKIYIEYKATPKGKPEDKGKLNFDVDSMAGNIADKWKSRMNNLAMVVDLGPFPRLMTIKGNFDAKKGQESAYGGDEGGFGGLPVPEIEFSPVLQTAMDILQILQDLSGGDYKDALKKGLKVAMSNSAGTWEYKFEAAKEIPVIKFPFGPLYEDPTQPLKLEASLKVGMYFNAALMITTDPKKLLPTAGAFVDFYGQVRVMCVSLAAATVYAVGQANLGIAGDTAKGPSLHMKFGFGVQLVVGLPVVGNVSVMYMAGVEISVDKTEVVVSAFLLFRGHAELIGGLVSITITIEAKGTIKRNLIENRTDCAAQVTFAIDISIFLVINIDFSESWEEARQIA